MFLTSPRSTQRSVSPLLDSSDGPLPSFPPDQLSSTLLTSLATSTTAPPGPAQAKVQPSPSIPGLGREDSASVVVSESLDMSFAAEDLQLALGMRVALLMFFYPCCVLFIDLLIWLGVLYPIGQLSEYSIALTPFQMAMFSPHRATIFRSCSKSLSRYFFGLGCPLRCMCVYSSAVMCT